MHSPSKRDVRQCFSRIRITKAVTVTVILLLLATIPAFLSHRFLSETNTELFIFYSIYFVPLALYFFVIRKHDLSYTAIFEDSARDYSAVWLFIPLIAFTIGVIWVTLLLLNNLSPEVAGSYLDWMNSIELFDITPETTLLQYLLIFVVISVLAPLVEEIIFRGVMIERFGLKYGYTKAVFISSFLFGVLHADVIGAFLFGVVLSVVYLKTRSLLLPFLIHAANNAAATLAIFFQDRFDAEPWLTIEPYIQHAWVGVLVFLASALWLVWYLKQNWSSVTSLRPFNKQEAVETNEMNDSIS